MGNPLENRIPNRIVVRRHIESAAFGFSRFFFPVVWIEQPFADSNVLRRHFNKLVIVDIADGFFQLQGARRGQPHGFVRP